MIPPDELLRARVVVRALQRLRELDLGPLAQGLDPGLAAVCLDAALAPLTVEALADAAWTHPVARRPASVGVVVAHGVFTSPIEWAALYATAGCRVQLKAPSADPALCLALARVLAEQGLPVTASTGRDLADLEAIVVFGDDQTGARVRAAWPAARVQVFGHRVSAALVEVPEDPAARRRLAADLARDVLLYDTRGCMAPTAVFARGDRGALAADLHAELAAAAWPRGPLDPALGPEWRRRVGLARALGCAWVGPDSAVLVLPADHYLPVALPRLVVLHPLQPEALGGVPLSSLAVGESPDLQAIAASLAPRTCPPGQLQTPPFPRLHDGVPMMGCVLRPEAP